MKIVLATSLLALVYWGFYMHEVNRQHRKPGWKWEGHAFNGNAKADQYLLGVGKADITG